MQITRPQLPLTGPISRADLQELNDITVTLDDTDKQAIVTEVQTALGNGVAGKNYLLNPAFDLWTRGTSFVGCPLSVRTFRSDDWWCRPNTIVSATPTYGRTDDTVHQAHLYAAKILGNSGVGTVDFGQDLAPRVAAAMGDSTPADSKCTFTFEIQNNTGASFTPTVRLDTCDNFGDYTSTTNRYSAAASGAVTNGAAKVWTVTIDTSGYTSDLRNGAQIYVRIPSGSLDSNAKYVNFYDCKLEIGGTATPRYVDPQPTGAETTDASTGSGVERNYLFNGEFDEHRWGPNTNCAAGVQTFAAQGWWARPSAGSTLNYSQAADSPNALTKYCTELTGDAALSAAVVDFGQDITAGNAMMLQQSVVFSIWVKNNTAAQITPELFIENPTALNDFNGSASLFTQQTLDACPIGIWTRLTYAFSGVGILNIEKGMRIYLRFDTGTLGTGADKVRIAQAKIELGALPTPFIPKPTFETVSGVQGAGSGIVLKSTGASTLNISAGALTLTSAAGDGFVARGISVTGVAITTSGVNGLDTGVEAANTWYAIWAISNGTVVRGLLSVSDTAPVLPGGYRYSALLGYVRNDGSSDFIGFYQVGRRVAQIAKVLFDSKGAAIYDTWEAISVPAGSGTVLAGLVPPAAAYVRGVVAWATATGGNDVATFAADANGLGQQHATVQAGVGASTSIHITTSVPGDSTVLRAPLAFNVPMTTAQEFYWKSNTAATKRVEIHGYDLP